jgi:hypothetical protein
MMSSMLQLRQHLYQLTRKEERNRALHLPNAQRNNLPSSSSVLHKSESQQITFWEFLTNIHLRPPPAKEIFWMSLQRRNCNVVKEAFWI